MPTSTQLVVLAGSLALALAGCIVDDDDVDEVGVVEQGLYKLCEDFGCGQNTVAVNLVYFGDLNLAGVPNDEGVVYTGMTSPGGFPRKLDVVPGGLYGTDVMSSRIVARDPVTNAILEQGTSLIGSYISIDVGGDVYWIRIAWVSLGLHFWAGDTTKRTESYYMEYIAPGGEVFQPLCSEVANGNGGTTEPGWAGHETHIVVSEGDRIDPTTKTITRAWAANLNWINMSCAGSAVAKLYLMRYLKSSGGAMTTAKQGQAMLNAIVAKYCTNSGQSFTSSNIPLLFRDELGLIPLTPPISWANGGQIGGGYEAVWGLDGAVCLNTTRLADTEGDNAMKQLIKNTCGYVPPSCPKSMFPNAWQLSGDVLTANPTGF